MQAAFFLIACGAGGRLVWLINRGNWRVVMRQVRRHVFQAGGCNFTTHDSFQSPPLATAWIYSIVQLNLVPSVVSLAGVTAYSWWKGLKLVP